MKEVIFIVVVLLVLMGFTVFKYRRQIASVYRFFAMLRSMRQMRPPGSVQDLPQEKAAGGVLVNCAKCGTWIPEDRAIRLGSKTIYCSTACLEKAVETN